MPYPYAPNSPLWSSDQHSPYYSEGAQYGKLAVGVGLFGAAAYAAPRMKIGDGGRSLLDFARSHIRFGAESSPFAVLNTFRASEFMSTYASPAAKGFRKSGDLYYYDVESQFLKTEETKKYLRKFFGEESFKKAGIDLDLTQDFELQFRQKEGALTGSVYARAVKTDITGQTSPIGQFTEIGRNVSTTEIRPFDTLQDGVRQSNIKSVNPAFFGFLQSQGIAEEFGTNSERKAGNIFAQMETGTEVKATKAYGFTRGDLLTQVRSFGAFEMNRLNRLLRGTFEQVPIVGQVAEGTARALGVDLSVTPGSAGKMFMRFGGLAARAGVLMAGVQTVDWARRNYSLPGEVMASGAVSLTAAAMTQNVIKSGSPRTAMMVGVASFFGQMLLPGFDQGVVQGIATTATKAHIASSALGAVTMMNTYRRTVEGFLPGISGMDVGALAGLGMIGLSFYNRQILDKMEPALRQRLGLRGDELFRSTGRQIVPESLNQTKGRMFGERLLDIMELGDRAAPKESYLAELERKGIINVRDTLEELGLFRDIESQDYDVLNRRNRTRVIKSLYQKVIGGSEGAEGASKLLDELHVNFERSVEAHRESIRSDNLINRSYAQRISEIDAKYNYGVDLTFGQRAARRAEKFGATLVHAFFGSELDSPAIKQAVGALGKKPMLGRYGSIFAVGFLAQQLVTGGLLGSMEDPSELSAVYSGRKKVAVRRGRWWEGGGTPFEGGEIEYYKPHAYVELMTRSRQKAVWGRNEDEISPIRKFFLKNFTYYIEETNYHNRPYPITGAAFEDIPVIGGLLSATLGRIVKPPKLMHTNEYMRMGPDGNMQFLHRRKPGDPSVELGGKTPGTPISPFASRHVAGQIQYQFRELAGLTGFAKNMIQQSITGTQTFETQRPVLASAGQMTDPAEQFWDLNLGGGLFTTEAIRRFLPRKQSEIEEYNPLQNRMPYWMPDRFKYGDPYRNVKQGYMRMPGAGYESLHPELQGFSMEEYPDIYKYSILADVAPMSKEFVQVREKMYQRRAQGITTNSENALMDSVDMLYNERLSGITMDQVHKNAIEFGLLSQATQGAYETAQTIVRKGVAPVEYMIPAGFRPVQKLMSDRDMIEQYEYERLYGNQFAFWDKPVRDWFRPAFYSTANIMGFEGKPLWRQEADATQEYFDRLQFQKSMMLAQQARMQGNGEATRKHLIDANKTRYGINPQASAMSIYMALPEAEKKFFDAFSSTTDERERRRILEMVPRDHQELYQSVWQRADAGDASLYVGSVANFDENNLTQKFYDLQAGGLGGPQPPVDWIGWRDDVQLDDIQLKYIDNIGQEIHDYGYWESQRRDLARKEYLEGSDEFLHMPAGLSPFGAAGTLYEAAKLSPDQRLPMETSAFMLEGSMQGGYGQMYYNDSRSGEYAAYFQGMMRDAR